jgi:hypothetical protein
MPVVFVPGKGNIQFPDNMTPYQITLAIEREILPNRRPETISAPKQPEGTIWNSIKGIGTSLGAGWDYLKATAQDISAGDLAEFASGQKGVGAAIDSIIPDIYGPDRAERAARAERFGAVAARTPEKQAALSARARAEAAAPNIESPVGRMAYTAASSLAQMAPGLIASAATGNPIPAVANIGAITFPEAYQRYEERGGTPQEALTGATAETVTEIATEMLPLGVVVKQLGKVGFGHFLKEFLGKELIGEEIATITQGAIDTAIANPDKTWGDYVKELPQQMVETAGATLLTGGVLAGAGAIAKRVTGAQEPMEEAPAAKRATEQTPPPPPPADFAKKLGAVGSKITLNEPDGVGTYTYHGMDADGRVIIEAEDGSMFAEDPAEINAAIDVGAVVPEAPVEAAAPVVPGVAFGEPVANEAAALANKVDVTEADFNARLDAEEAKLNAAREEALKLKAETENKPVSQPAPAPSKPGPMPLPLAKDAKDIIGEYSQGRETSDLQQIFSIASDLARQYGKKSITKDILFKAGQRFDGIPPVAPQAAAPVKPEGKFTVTLPPKADTGPDFGPDLKRIMGLFHPSIREGFKLPEIKKTIEEGKPFKAGDLPKSMYMNLKPADRKIMEQAFIKNPQQVLDAAQTTPFKTPEGEVVRNTSSDTGANLPIDENNLKSMKEMQRTRTPAFMADLEKEARQIASNEGAPSVSSQHFAEALNNNASRLNGRKVAFAGDWRESLAEAFNKPKEKPKPKPGPAAPRAVGGKATVTIPATRNKVEVQDELLDLADVKFAEGELQNRDRSRPQTQQFLRRFTSEFDPEGLGEDRSTDRGAPIINKDNVILSGNGRTMGLEEIYEKHPEQAEEYRQFLRDNGWNIEGIERPFLARRLLSDVDEREFVTGSNEADIAALSPPEQAAQDAQDILKPAVLAKYNGGDLKAAKNDAFVSAFLAEMSPQQRENAMDDKGNISAQALKRIENALLYKAYGQAGRASEVFISKAMERSDDDTKTLTNALVDVANDWIKFQQAIKAGEIDKKYDITGKLMEAVATVSDIKSSGNSVSGALRSEDMITPMDPFIKEILAAFHNDKLTRMLSKKAIAEKLQDYVDIAANQQAAPDMFGKAETPSAREVWKRIKDAEQDLFRSIEPMPPERQQDVIDEARRVPSLSRGVAKIVKKWDKGLIDDAEFAQWVSDLSDYVAEMKEAKRFKGAQKGRVRGADRIIEIMVRAKRQGVLSEEAVDFMSWALKWNPNLANDLAISLLKPKEKSPGGSYDNVRRLMRLFKDRASDTTAVHEMLHHTERMMPEDIQQAIRDTWLREFKKAEKKGGSDQRIQTFFKAIRAMNSGQSFSFAGEMQPPSKGWDIALNLIDLGHVPYSYYQYVNPSEFWAVNATDIMKKRFDVKDSTLGRMKNWLSELVEKAKGLFNLSSKSPLIKALDSLAKADGKFNSLSMLDENINKFNEGPSEVTSIKEARDERLRKSLEKEIGEFNERLDGLSNAMDKEPEFLPQMQVSIKKALQSAYNKLDDLYINAPTDLEPALDDIEERIVELQKRLEAELPQVANQNAKAQPALLKKTSSKYNQPREERVAESESQIKARKEYEEAEAAAIQAEDEFIKFAFNPEDERPIMDRRSKAYKEWAKESDRLEKINDEAKSRFEKAIAKRDQETLNAINKGSPAEMKKAIAKAQEPDNKIMDQRADIQKKNRGCD